MLKLEDLLTHEGLPPKWGTSQSLCFDIPIISHSIGFSEGNWFHKCHTGLRLTPLCKQEGLHLKLYIRSSAALAGYSLANSVGIIDCDYPGEIIAMVIGSGGLADFLTKKNGYILQGEFVKGIITPPADISIRTGGFGSTDKNNKAETI